MQGGWRVGSIFGIPLWVDPSWFLILLWFSAANSTEWPGYPTGLAWILGLVTALLLFGSVLVHELGHSLAARSQGIAVNSITLFMFGGVAAIDRESKTPGGALQVAIAGPAVSLALFLMLTVVERSFPGSSLAQLCDRLADINLVLAVFNMIPGLPLDGGQVLKALIWKVTGSRFKGVRWAAKAGQAIGWLGIFLALWLITFVPGGLQGWWIGLIGWFCLRNAASYEQLSAIQEALMEETVERAMARDFRLVDGHLSLRDFVDRYLVAADRPQYFVTLDGRDRGRIDPEALNVIDRDRWAWVRVVEAIEPLDQLVSLPTPTPLAQATLLLEDQHITSLVVVTPTGAVAGTLDRADIARAVTQRLKLSLSEAEFQRCKAEHCYPAGLNLGAIARTLSEELA
ncbi:MAG: site-2 protease family protein [Oscillatoriales cyanobacterium]|nr:MAG: site-2 protease family protein [Oscillatoriales cyanobacterium]